MSIIAFMRIVGSRQIDFAILVAHMPQESESLKYIHSSGVRSGVAHFARVLLLSLPFLSVLAFSVWSQSLPILASQSVRNSSGESKFAPATESLLLVSVRTTGLSLTPNASVAHPLSLRSAVSSSGNFPGMPVNYGNEGTTVPETRFEHRFWDRENDLLFAAVGASRTLDYFSTLNFRRRGRNEALLTNDIVDNHAAFASIEAGATALSLGVSYLFHRSHHHRLERWTSIVHASLATSGAIRNYCLKTAHP